MTQPISGSIPPLPSQDLSALRDRLQGDVLFFHQALSSFDPSNPDHLLRISEAVLAIHASSSEANRC